MSRRRRFRAGAFLAWALLCASFSCAETAAAPSVAWEAPQIEAQGSMIPNGQSLAFDSADRAHISYIDYTSGNIIKYAYYNGSSWQVTAFHNVRAGSAQQTTSIQIDAAGYPHIAVPGGGGISYIYKDAGGWHFETVGEVDETPSLRIGSDGKPRMAFVARDNPRNKRHIMYAVRSAGVWTVEEATNTPDENTGLHWGWCALALGPGDQPNITYWDLTTRDIKYTYKSGSWIKITLDSGSEDTGRLNDIAMDASGRRYIAYTDDTNSRLMVAYQTGSGWIWDTVYSGVMPFKGLDIDVRSDGTIGLGFLIGSTMHYAYRPPSGTWQSATRTGVTGGEHIGFRFNKAGTPSFAHSGEGTAANDLFFSTFGGAWSTAQLVDDSGSTGQYGIGTATDGEMAVYGVSGVGQIRTSGIQYGGFVDHGPGAYRFPDTAHSADRSYVSYYHSGDTALQVAEYGGYPPLYSPYAWPSTTVDNTGNVGQYTSIAVDGSGWPHVSYYDVTNSWLKYAKKGSGGWTVQGVDTGGSAGWDTSLAVNNSGNPRISYYDIANEQLKFAWSNGGAWNPATVDSSSGTGEYTGLAYDAANQPHISYFDRTNGALKYAKGPIGSWSIATVEGGGVGQFTSIAVDTSNNPHIAYYDQSRGDLKHAWFDGATWRTQTLDSAGVVGQNTAIGIKGAAITIYYYDATNRWTKSIAGWVDYTPPTTPIITDDGAFTRSSTQLRATWTCTDAETGIAESEYAIGTSPTDPGGGYVVPWTSAGGSMGRTVTGLSLANGQTYYFYVRCRNRAGVWSQVGVSDGIRIAAAATRISDAKQLPDGTWVALEDKVVSRDASYYFTYVQEQDRSSGILLYNESAAMPLTLTRGRLARIFGTMGRRFGQRSIENVEAAPGAFVGAPEPLIMTNVRVGGGPFLYNPGPPATGEPGTTGSYGLNNSGLLVRTSGRVTAVYPTAQFTISDGSSRFELPVSGAGTFPTPLVGDYVMVTGNAGPGGVYQMGPSPEGWVKLD